MRRKPPPARRGLASIWVAVVLDCEGQWDMSSGQYGDDPVNPQGLAKRHACWFKSSMHRSDLLIIRLDSEPTAKRGVLQHHRRSRAASARGLSPAVEVGQALEGGHEMHLESKIGSTGAFWNIGALVVRVGGSCLVLPHAQGRERAPSHWQRAMQAAPGRAVMETMTWRRR